MSGLTCPTWAPPPRRAPRAPNPRKAPKGQQYKGKGLDPLTSVDLPIFSIHGNHDDPTMDGQGELLCSLDLLAAAGLVNFFGLQDDVDKVEIEAVLLEKGSTRVAIYGMGSMRDERLNR